MTLRIKNFDKYQHYKKSNRRPPWVKLHRSMFDDPVFMKLSLASRGLLMQLWLIATENQGEIGATPGEIAWRLRVNRIDLKPLLESGLLIDIDAPVADASNVIADASVDSRVEGRVKRGSLREALDPGFELFWSVYPRKQAKKKAMEVWAKIAPSADLAAWIVKAVESSIKAKDVWEERRYIPYPATWLNQQRWTDEIHLAAPPKEKPKKIVCPKCQKPMESEDSGMCLSCHEKWMGRDR